MNMPRATRCELVRVKSKAKVLTVSWKLMQFFKSVLDVNKRKVWNNIVFKCQESYLIHSNILV